MAHRYHGNGEVIRREEFIQRKQAAEELQLARLNTKAKRMASAGKKFDGLPVLQVLDNLRLATYLQKPKNRGSSFMGLPALLALQLVHLAISNSI